MAMHVKISTVSPSSLTVESVTHWQRGYLLL